jgi:excisionase family DNA binding protein
MPSVKDAARLLGLSVDSVYALCKARKLKHRRKGMRQGRIEITEEAISEYLASCDVDIEQPPIPAPVVKPLQKAKPGLRFDGKPRVIVI